MDKVKLFMDKIKKLSDFNRVKFVILYGSVAQKKDNKFSDIDFCVYYEGNKKTAYNLRKKLLGHLNGNYDVQIFQSLPLYLRKEVLRGKVIYAKDLDFLYDMAYSTIKEFDDFKKYYYEYIEHYEKRDN